MSTGLPIFNSSSPLRVAVLTSIHSADSLEQAQGAKARLNKDGLFVTAIRESLGQGIDLAYLAADATEVDEVVITAGSVALLDPPQLSALYLPGAPSQILVDAYRRGRPVGAIGIGSQALTAVNPLETRRWDTHESRWKISTCRTFIDDARSTCEISQQCTTYLHRMVKISRERSHNGPCAARAAYRIGRRLRPNDFGARPCDTQTCGVD
ncbi:hypothetical protein GQ53DRAFT_806796 [Thozetella sp. PMI_491]|nr:hypothetical protein GQ53DRAFT_806796 [Thozetella sp. PMI_491]